MFTPPQKGNCKMCKRDMSNNYGGLNGICSDCLRVGFVHSDTVECPRCCHRWRWLHFNDRYIPDYFDKRADGRIGQTIKCSQCGYSRHTQIYWKRYNKTPHRMAWIAACRAKKKGIGLKTVTVSQSKGHILITTFEKLDNNIANSTVTTVTDNPNNGAATNLTEGKGEAGVESN